MDRMDYQASPCLCKLLENIARESAPYSNGGFVDPHLDWSNLPVDPFQVILFTCRPGRTFDDFNRSLQSALTKSSWQAAPYGWHDPHDSRHACGLLVLCSSQPQLGSDIFSLLDDLLIDPMLTWLCCHPNIAFYSPELPWLAAVVISISQDWVNVQHVWETALKRNKDDDDEMPDWTDPMEIIDTVMADLYPEIQEVVGLVWGVNGGREVAVLLCQFLSKMI